MKTGSTIVNSLYTIGDFNENYQNINMSIIGKTLNNKVVFVY